MGFRNYVKNIQPVRHGATAIAKMGVGASAPTLDKIVFTLSGANFDVSKIAGVRGMMNGREFYVDKDGATHNKRRAYLGLATNNDELVLDFTEPNARSAIEQNLSALPMSMMQSLQFELDIVDDAAVVPQIVGLAYFRAPTKNPYVKKLRKLSQAFSAAGEQVIYVPNGPSGGKLVRVWIHEGIAGNITKAELRARNAVGVETTRSEAERSQAQNGLVPQAGIFVLDFIEDGNLSGWFDTSALSEVELRLTGTAADAYTVYLEYLDPIGRL